MDEFNDLPKSINWDLFKDSLPHVNESTYSVDGRKTKKEPEYGWISWKVFKYLWIFQTNSALSFQRCDQGQL